MIDATLPTLDEIESTLNDTLYSSFDTGYYVGMMSGTSLDGLDAVICQFDAEQLEDDDKDDASSDLDPDIKTAITTQSPGKIVATHSANFPPRLRQVLLALCQPNATNQLPDFSEPLSEPLKEDYLNLSDPPRSELEWFGWASHAYAEFASTVISALLEKSKVVAADILAIGCHGQTVRHCPDLKFSLQLVDPNIIAERTGISVVTDFRRRDMVVGGQGAPLAPAFHLAQFGATSQSSTNRVIVNLGGISNITVLPANQPDKVIGYDTGPANILLDAWYQSHVDALNAASETAIDEPKINTPAYHPLFDKGGKWAQSGQVNSSLLSRLLSHPYFEQPTPKSTGREAFHLDWLTTQLQAWQQDNSPHAIRPQDVQATLTAFTARTLCDAIDAETQRLGMSQGDIIVCGGGAYNGFLLSQIADLLPKWTVLTSNEFGIAPSWVESMAFAWLARQTIMGEVGNLPAVTGADKAVVLGQVCFA